MPGNFFQRLPVPCLIRRISLLDLKKPEDWRIDTFKLWRWKRLLRVPGTAWSNQSILREISPEYSLEELMLELKLQYFGHLMQRVDALEKTLMLGKTKGEEGDRGWDGWRASPIQWTWAWANSGRQWRTRKPGVLKSMGSQKVGRDLATEQQFMCVRLTVSAGDLFHLNTED